MSEDPPQIKVHFQAEQILYSCQENLKSYKKLRLKGKGTRAYHYLINVPKIFVGKKYFPDKSYAVSFGVNKQNNHQLVVIDLDDQEKLSTEI